jgi:hypothetical protein
MVGPRQEFFDGERSEYKASAQSQKHMEGKEINIEITDADGRADDIFQE